MYYILSVHFLHKKFISSEIQTHFYIGTPISTLVPQIFHISKFELFDLMNPKIWTSQIPSSTQNEPKEPKRFKINPHLNHQTAIIPILLEDLAYRWFDLAPLIWLAFSKSSQIVKPTSNHPKITMIRILRTFFNHICESHPAPVSQEVRGRGGVPTPNPLIFRQILKLKLGLSWPSQIPLCRTHNFLSISGELHKKDRPVSQNYLHKQNCPTILYKYELTQTPHV